jgi:Helix-turn-helix domain
MRSVPPVVNWSACRLLMPNEPSKVRLDSSSVPPFSICCGGTNFGSTYKNRSALDGVGGALMKRAGVRVGVGTRFLYDGEVVEVVEMHPVGGMQEVLATGSRTEVVRRFAISELMSSDRSRLLSEDLVVTNAGTVDGGASVEWSAAPESARNQARERSAHVREALTGYRSGCAETALPLEPRPCYNQALAKQARLAPKAKELGIGFRTFERWVSRYEADGEVGLLTARAARPTLRSKSSSYSRKLHLT